MPNALYSFAATLSLIALGATLAPAQAAPVVFFGEDGNPTRTVPIAHPISDTTRTSFLSNLTNPGTENLDKFAAGTTTVNANFANGVTATLSGGRIRNVPDSSLFAISSPNYYLTETASFSIVFNAAISAFGFYGTDIGDYGGVLTLTLTDLVNAKTTLTVPAIPGTNGSQPANGSVLYYGFYDTTNTYKSIAFNNSSTNDAFGFDDFTVGTAIQVVANVPEPASLALLGMGVAGIAAMRRRQIG